MVWFDDEWKSNPCPLCAAVCQPVEPVDVLDEGDHSSREFWECFQGVMYLYNGLTSLRLLKEPLYFILKSWTPAPDGDDDGPCSRDRKLKAFSARHPLKEHFSPYKVIGRVFLNDSLWALLCYCQQPVDDGGLIGQPSPLPCELRQEMISEVKFLWFFDCLFLQIWFMPRRAFKDCFSGYGGSQRRLSGLTCW